jgi:hypothetical protein
MSRKPTATIQLKLRIRESLRRKLADQAERHRFSLNNEIRYRLEQSLEAQDRLEFAALLGHLSNHIDRMDARDSLAGALLDRMDARDKAAEAVLVQIKEVLDRVDATRRDRAPGETP